MIGIITGSGLYELPALEQVERSVVDTPYGATSVRIGSLDGQDIVFVARHGEAHELVSNMVNHRANVYALREAGARAIVSTSVMGIVDASLELAQLVLFDDLYFPDNRLPDGGACTFFSEPGQNGRGHYIFGSPFSAAMRAAALEAAQGIGARVADGGVYAHVNGPRFNSRAEIRQLRSLGVTAVSQTCGPEAVLAGELEVPYLLIGFGVDYANGVVEEPTPIEVLDANLVRAARLMPALIRDMAARLGGTEIPFEGFVYRFE